MQKASLRVTQPMGLEAGERQTLRWENLASVGRARSRACPGRLRSGAVRKAGGAGEAGPECSR